MTIADVELSISRRADGVTTISMRVDLPHQRVDPVHGVPININDAVLTTLANDPEVYGATLTAMLFPASLREAWREARGYADGRSEPLRVRLALEGDYRLHAVRWELLRDPVDSSPLAYSERTRLSRFLSTTSYRPLQRVGRPELRAVVAVANPNWLPPGLAPIDVTDEVARAQQALNDVQTTVVDGQEGRRAPTLPEIAAALRDGADILYLVCHGTLVEGRPYLYLERQVGEPKHPVSGDDLVEVIASLDSRPLLVVLASCRSAGDNYETLAAVGPQLARVGVGGVIAMQGNVPMELVAQLMPRLCSELQRDGQIDRALAAARSALPAGSPWWGNQDLWADDHLIVRQLSAVGVRVLLNSNERLPPPHDHVWVCGWTIRPLAGLRSRQPLRGRTACGSC
jgi:CHAT domain